MAATNSHFADRTSLLLGYRKLAYKPASALATSERMHSHRIDNDLGPCWYFLVFWLGRVTTLPSVLGQ